MKLSETTFSEMKEWMSDPTKFYYRRMNELPYMTWSRLKIIYDYCVKHGMTCSGPRCTVKWKGGEFICGFSEDLMYKPKREDFVWNMFHEIWCKTEWAVRCTQSEMELGYESVKAMFGLETIKALRKAG